MVHADRRLVAVRDAGEVVIEVLEIGFRPALDKNGSDDQQLEDDSRYGPCLDALRNIMSELGSVEVRSYPEAPSIRRLVAKRHFNDELLCELSVLYRSDGTGQIFLSVETANGTITPIEGEDFELSSLNVGRYVAQAELAVLVAELGSCAEALDYWIKSGKNLTYEGDGVYNYESESNSQLSPSWHTIRGVTKQAVSNNSKSAEKSLHKLSEDSDPWI